MKPPSLYRSLCDISTEPYENDEDDKNYISWNDEKPENDKEPENYYS
ncbi:hypothetical protein A3Q56_01107 [Intoshia linei]|uniref:Uncharacterized protein n=1 Tax=Intoshia linei TaxID=1819745 RepID=A0A177BBV6_9BILA|nr:hypothetical protein A3Q56_01107 [Intoshia linei]